MLIIEPVIEKYSLPIRTDNEKCTWKTGEGRKHKNLRVYLNTIIYVCLTRVHCDVVYPYAECLLCYGKAAHRWHMRWSHMPSILY